MVDPYVLFVRGLLGLLTDVESLGYLPARKQRLKLTKENCDVKYCWYVEYNYRFWMRW